VPLHSSTVEALVAYAHRRDRLCPRPREQAFFISTAGTRLLYCNVHLAWQTWSAARGFNAVQPHAGPVRTTCATALPCGRCSAGIATGLSTPLENSLAVDIRRVNGHLHLPELRAALERHVRETGTPVRHNQTSNAA
jgi:hypothetical protein